MGDDPGRAGVGGGASGGWLFRDTRADAICLYRAGLGILLGGIAIFWLPHATELFSNEGFHLGPLAAYAPTPTLAFGLCIALLVSSLGVAVGFFTRASLVLTLALWSFLYAVDTINEKANSTIAIVTLAVLLFSPCARRYSVDAWRASRRGGRRPADTACVLPQRLLQLEFAQIYLFAGLVKVTNADWWSGLTIARALGSRWGTELGVWLSGWIPPRLSGAASIGSMTYELLAAVLLFLPRTRKWAIICGVVFHVAIQATLVVGVLGLHFLLALLILFPDPEAVSRRARRVFARKLGSD